MTFKLDISEGDKVVKAVLYAKHGRRWLKVCSLSSTQGASPDLTEPRRWVLMKASESIARRMADPSFGCEPAL